jgi:hypothetical protein
MKYSKSAKIERGIAKEQWSVQGDGEKVFCSGKKLMQSVSDCLSVNLFQVTRT